MSSESGVYELYKDCYVYMSKEEVDKISFDGVYPRKVSEEEQRDISYLVDERFIAFFTDLDSDFEEQYEEGIMYEFRMKVIKAYQATYGFDTHKMVTEPRWVEMRNKYGTSDYDMPHYLEEFSNVEIIAFLEHCIWRDSRHFPEAYTDWAKNGVIGKALLRLKELPLSLDE